LKRFTRVLNNNVPVQNSIQIYRDSDFLEPSKPQKPIVQPKIHKNFVNHNNNNDNNIQNVQPKRSTLIPSSVPIVNLNLNKQEEETKQQPQQTQTQIPVLSTQLPTFQERTKENRAPITNWTQPLKVIVFLK
jgi:hypothetical protein